MPQPQVLLETSFSKISDQYQSCTGLYNLSNRLKTSSSAPTSSLSKIDVNGTVLVSATNLSDNQITLNIETEKADCKILKPDLIT